MRKKPRQAVVWGEGGREGETETETERAAWALGVLSSLGWGRPSFWASSGRSPRFVWPQAGTCPDSGAPCARHPSAKADSSTSVSGNLAGCAPFSDPEEPFCRCVVPEVSLSSGSGNRWSVFRPSRMQLLAPAVTFSLKLLSLGAVQLLLQY